MEFLEPFRDGCTLRLLLMRHGAVEERAAGRCYGHTNYCLSDAGREQVVQSLARLEQQTVDVIYSSPLIRAMESARIAAQCFGREPQTVADLSEMNFGSFEGLTYEEIERLHPAEYKAWMEQPASVQFPGGESLAQVKERVLHFVKGLEERHAEETVLVIAHAGVNRIVLCDAFGFEDESIFKLPQEHAALNVIDYFSGAVSVRMLGA